MPFSTVRLILYLFTTLKEILLIAIRPVWNYSDIREMIYRTLTLPTCWKVNILLKYIVALEELLKTGSQKEPLEFYAKSKDGRYFYIETKSSLIMKDGNPYAVQGIARDITERKKIQNKLLENERFLDSIIENIPDALFVKDAIEHRFLKVNKAAQDMFGFSKEELIGKNDYDFFSKRKCRFLCRQG